MFSATDAGKNDQDSTFEGTDKCGWSHLLHFCAPLAGCRPEPFKCISSELHVCWMWLFSSWERAGLCLAISKGRHIKDVSAYTICVGAAENSIEAFEENFRLVFTNAFFTQMLFWLTVSAKMPSPQLILSPEWEYDNLVQSRVATKLWYKHNCVTVPKNAIHQNLHSLGTQMPRIFQC